VRNGVYLDVFQQSLPCTPVLSKYSRIFALHLTSQGLIPESSTDQKCTFFYRACGCLLRCAVRLLRVCRMVYIEMQPYPIAERHTCFPVGHAPGGLHIADHQYHMGPSRRLGLFRQRFLNSSLSGRVSITLLCRLYLQFDFHSYFSKRTRTGCLKCGRRKKECDEGQPQCKPKYSCALNTYLTSVILRSSIGMNYIRRGS
jgi:hypothetical protein